MKTNGYGGEPTDWMRVLAWAVLGALALAAVALIVMLVVHEPWFAVGFLAPIGVVLAAGWAVDYLDL